MSGAERPDHERTPRERVEDAEPSGAGKRLTDVTRHDPTLDAHVDHDPLLIAALVEGDLDVAGTELAGGRLATCEACAALAADLAAISAAVRVLPAPSRPRDFRITAEQAAALERRGLRRFIPALPSVGFARPLGTALATLGVAGLLFTGVLGTGASTAILSNIGAPIGASSGAGYAASSAPEAAKGNRDTASGGGQAVGPLAPSPASSAVPQASPASSAAAVPSAAPSPAIASPVALPSPASSPALQPPSTPPSVSGEVVNPAPTSGPTLASNGGSTVAPGVPSDLGHAASTGGLPVLPIASIVALIAGFGLIGVDLLLRRR